MRTLVVEDDGISRLFMQKFLSEFGDCDVVVDGLEAIEAILIAIQDDTLYDLVCLDIMMPKVDGVRVLKAIRELEKQKGLSSSKCTKVIITSALEESELVHKAFNLGCEAYASKPINTEKFLNTLKDLKLIPW